MISLIFFLSPGAGTGKKIDTLYELYKYFMITVFTDDGKLRPLKYNQESSQSIFKGLLQTCVALYGENKLIIS